MKHTFLMAILIGGLAAPVLADTTNAPGTPAMPPGAPQNGPFADDNARYSYMLGMRMGTSLKQINFPVDDTLLLQGVKDAQSGGPALLTPQQVSESFAEFSKMAQAKQAAMLQAMGAKNKAEGEAFLATNKNNPGVITLADGLQYKVLQEGDGPLPNAASQVTVNYRGTFINGTEFDSSAKAGHPVTFAVTGQVIKGWTEALKLMKTGSKWQLYIPPALAYGEQGRGPVPPSSTLIFDVELLSIEPPKAAPVAPVRPAAGVPMAPARPAATAPASGPTLTSDIIKVQGTNIELIKSEDVQKAQQQQQQQKP
jgi:FKBP-type peptidyl-prolyl cis-trans isomerase